MFVEVKEQLRKVSVILSTEKDFHSPNDLWNLLLNIKVYGRVDCPFLFHIFLLIFLSDEEYVNAMENSEVFEKQKKRYFYKFYFLIFFCCKILNPKSSNSLFWLSYCLQFYGLSNNGLDFLASFGCSLTSRHHRRLSLIHRAKLSETIKIKTKTFPAVVWIDNYSHYLRHQIPTLNAWDPSVNFTAVTYTFLPKNSIIYPGFKIDCSWLTTFYQDSFLLRSLNGAGCYLTICKTIQLDQLTVPLRISGSYYNSFDNIPVSIVDKNCSSITGLDNCLETVLREIPGEFILKCDINIYWRLITYYFHPSKFSLVERIQPFLGVWHIFKITAQKIHSYFANTFFAGIGFSLNQISVIEQPKLPYCLTLYQYLFSAIPYIGCLIENLETKEISSVCSDFLFNLKILLFDWIPLLLDFGYSLAARNFTLFHSLLPDILIILLECGCSGYSSAVYMFISQLTWYVTNKESMIELFSYYFDALIEEKNEILLSFLARAVQTHPNKRSCDHLDGKFKSLFSGSSYLRSFRNSTDSKNSPRVIGRKGVKSDCTAAIESYFEAEYISIVTSTWKYWKKGKKFLASDNRSCIDTITRIYSSKDSKLEVLKASVNRKIETWKTLLKS
jgi:hypothetical protein